jgi:phage shock protein A
MGRFFRRMWKYLGASANKKFDERADPEVQIQQAIEESQKRHQELTKQAASIIGSQRQLEMQIARAADEVTRLQGNARQALVMSDAAKTSGDAAKAAHLEETASTFAAQLVTAEGALEDLKTQHGQAEQASAAAKAAVEQNARRLQKDMNERTKLMTQLQAAKMQEQVAKQMDSVGKLSAPGDTPSLDQVRDRIEQRYATAMGTTELAQGSVEGRMLEVEKASIDAAAASKLDEIRASLGTGKPEKQLTAEPSAEAAPPAS